MTSRLDPAALDPAVRHDMVLLFDITDGNPNGDPDAGNRPRQDQETLHGLTTDVSLKRKIRDTVALLRPDNERFQIFIQAGKPLNTTLEASYEAVGLKGKKKPDTEQVEAARQWLFQRYYDIRMFGAVLATGNTLALGRLAGPMQVTNARTIDPISPTEYAITRVTPTKADADKETEMGGKWSVPYGLYRAHIHYSAPQARKTGVTEDDLSAFYQAVTMMFEHTRSASRASMSVQGLWVFNHADGFGQAPAQALTRRVTVHRRDPRKSTPARSVDDYAVAVEETGLPDGVSFSTVVPFTADHAIPVPAA